MTKRGSGIGWIIGCVVVFFGGLVVLGAGGAAFYLLQGEQSDGPAVRESRSFVALADGALLSVGGGIASPLTVRREEVRGASLAGGWTWAAPSGLGVHPWQWQAGPAGTSAASLAIGEVHRTTGVGAPRLDVFHVTAGGGWRASIDPIVSGSWLLTDDGRAIGASDTNVRVIRVPPTGALATTDFALSGGQFVPWVGASSRHVVLWNGTLSVLGADGGAPAHTLAPLGDVVGVAAQRDEVLVLRDGRLVAVSLETGVDRVTIDLAGPGATLTDGLDDPCLMGGHAGRWLVVYTTGLDHSTSVNGRNWLTPAERVLAAIYAESGQVSWRLPLGRWQIRCRSDMRHVLPSDAELGANVLLYGEHDEAQGAEVQGTLMSVALDTGALGWRATYPRATRANHLFLRRGAATYLKVLDAHDILRWALVRFESGRLTGASWFPRMNEPRPPAITAESVWASTDDGWLRLAAPSLSIAAGSGERAGFVDARAWAIERLSLPPEAQTR